MARALGPCQRRIWEDVICRFREEYKAFSNMYDLDKNLEGFCVTLDGECYPSTEHAFMAAKTLDPNLRLRIKGFIDPRKAKAFARKMPLRDDWELVKVGIMNELVHQKFSHPVLKQLLVETGDRHILEGNTWDDVFWGMALREAKLVGENHLGRILMDIRSAHQAEVT